VDVARRVINGTMESRLEPGPKDSYFNCGLTQWKELNCTQDFAEFLKDIVSLVQTFNLVVFYKAEIVGILIKHLRKPHSQAYEPLLRYLFFIV
jgi:hypothetical protein